MFWITPVDLSATVSLMRSSYSPKTKGRKPRDPADMLRSLLIMTKLEDEALMTGYVRFAPRLFMPFSAALPLTMRLESVLSTTSFEGLWKASTPHKRRGA